MKDYGIRIKGHRGKWYVIGVISTYEKGNLYLLEHEFYGEDAASIIIDKDYNIVLENVKNGFSDYYDYKEA